MRAPTTPTPDPTPSAPRRARFDRGLSAAIDRALEQLEAATDPEVRAAWRKVLDDLEAQILELDE